MSSEALECRYFVTYSGVQLPLKLTTPLQEADLQNRNTFFRGYFDAEHRLMRCQKLVYAAIELEHNYAYDAEGKLQCAEITDADGEIHILHFDKAGKLQS